ncbi:MAG: tRNA uridine-5-carboxymethylaminomethyl(34) synthesis GTPase MnmE [Alphaproteobacteria bacterium]
MIETIFALSSAAGKAGVAVVRVSGPQALQSFESLTGHRSPQFRKAMLCALRDNVSRETIDKALVIFFENPQSFTGEDVAEYHVHGSKAVIDRLLDVLARQPNHRMAEPGEFTRRAFENGKLDLTEAEAVADLINAQTQMQRLQALRQLDGGLKRLYEGWSERLSRALAYLEADLEFPDEDDAEGAARHVFPDLEKLMGNIAEHLRDNKRGEIVRDGFRIAIIGAANAGKSSLMNILAQRDVAIVSEIAGTTRDAIEVQLDLEGYAVVLTDTAGLRASGVLSDSGQDVIEQEGIRRTLRAAEEADLKILLFDGEASEPDPQTLSFLDEYSIATVSKADKPRMLEYPAPLLAISSKTGEGIEALLQTIKTRIDERIGGYEGLSLTRLRHRLALERSLESLNRAIGGNALPELVAEDVRLAMRHLGQITGRIDVEDLLDIVFRDFCIGK